MLATATVAKKSSLRRTPMHIIKKTEGKYGNTKVIHVYPSEGKRIDFIEHYRCGRCEEYHPIHISLDYLVDLETRYFLCPSCKKKFSKHFNENPQRINNLEKSLQNIFNKLEKNRHGCRITNKLNLRNECVVWKRNKDGQAKRCWRWSSPSHPI